MPKVWAQMVMPKPYFDRDGIIIYHGDCQDILPKIISESVDMVLTDPPYGHNNNDGDLIHKREEALGLTKHNHVIPGDARPIANDSVEDSARIVKYIFKESARLLKPGCCCCCCCCGGGGPDPQFARWSLWLDAEIPFKHAVVWDKGGLGMGWHYRRNYELILIAQKPGAACNWHGDKSVANVMRYSGIKPSASDHPTPKPVSLMSRFISLHTAPGETVLDPLMGGGSTLVAAKMLGRKAIGIDLDERWCELAASRLTKRTKSGISKRKRLNHHKRKKGAAR